MVDIISRSDIIENIRSCIRWIELYNLIVNNPRRYNVHLCLANCNRTLICRDLIFSLVHNNYLNFNDISSEYDFFQDPEINVIGNRTFADYMQFLAEVAIRENDRVAMDRYTDAWNAPEEVRQICNGNQAVA